MMPRPKIFQTADYQENNKKVPIGCKIRLKTGLRQIYNQPVTINNWQSCNRKIISPWKS